jgi:hypothetical protein
MSDFDVFDDPDYVPPDHLLDELESIKDILQEGEAALPTDIPLLDDMVVANLDANTKLLNLNRIFEEDSETDEAVVDEAAATETAYIDTPFPRFSLDTMLTEDASEASAPIAPRPVTQKPSPTAPRVRPDYSREVLIQELVDEFIPQIEAELRARLGHLDTATLKSWKDSK